MLFQEYSRFATTFIHPPLAILKEGCGAARGGGGAVRPGSGGLRPRPAPWMSGGVGTVLGAWVQALAVESGAVGP